MVQSKRKVRSRDAALSRAQVVSAAIVILDRDGETGLTFKALASHLTTGPGAIYGHIASKSDLVAAAADAIVAEVIGARTGNARPQDSMKEFALEMFDAIDTHPWVGAALTRMSGQAPLVRILDTIGQDIRDLGVPSNKEWAATMAIFNYIVGVGGQNAANAQFARAHALERTKTLASLARAWSDLDPAKYPFASTVGSQLAIHDDRTDFLAGIEFIIGGIVALTAGTGEASR
ncbi:TetR/AcrR family transcriptional regulator [Agrobacterium sp. 22-226-1]